MAGAKETPQPPRLPVLPLEGSAAARTAALCEPAGHSDTVLRLLSPSSDVPARAACPGGARPGAQSCPRSPGFPRETRSGAGGLAPHCASSLLSPGNAVGPKWV